jgi:hypothetical protein
VEEGGGALLVLEPRHGRGRQLEEEGRGEKGRKEKKKGKKKKKKKEKKKKKKENRKIKGKEIGKRFRKLGKLLGILGKRTLRGFFRFPGVSVIFGTAVMARQTGRRDRGVAVFSAWWLTATLGRHAWAMARVRAVPAGSTTRAPRVRENGRGFEKRG